MSKALSRWIKKYWLEIVLVLPMTIYIMVMTIRPMVQTIILGFKDQNTGQWSLSTYQKLFARPDFVQSILNTILIAIMSLVFQLVVAYIIASVLKRKFFGRGLVRSLVLMPMGIPTLVSGAIAMFIFSNSGYLNSLLYSMHLIKTPIVWLTSDFKGMVVLMLADTWKVLPTIVLLMLAGLESISDEIYEAAEIDGSSRWYTLIHITLPLLKPTITMAALFRAVDVFRIFELPQVLVGKSMPFVATFAYEEYDLGNFNGSGAASTILLLLIMVFAVLWMKFIDKGDGFRNDF